MRAIVPNLRLHPTLLLRLFLALLLVFAQQAVLQHPYSHDDEWQESAQHQHDKKAPHTDQCTRCITIAGLSGTIGVQALVLHTPAATHDFRLPVLPAYVSSTTLPYRSRAPPSLA